MTPAWPWPARLLFRFGFAYFALFLLPDLLLHPVDEWVGIHWFSSTREILNPSPSGSGDKTIDWVHTFNLLILAFLATGVWSIADRKRTEYSWLLGWTRLGLRYWLALVLLEYGFAKVFPTQFQTPMPFTLMARFGDFSPMAVLWNFMGASMGYTIFAGAMEVIAALLLLVRRTALLGALLAMGIMANVFALNMFYDVPVKLYSFHLLVMATFIAAPDLGRLARFFVLQRPVDAPSPPGPVVQTRGWTTAAAAGKGLLVLALVAQSAFTYNNVANLPKAPIQGLFEVVKSNGPQSWDRVLFDRAPTIQVWIGGRMEFFLTEWKPQKSQVVIQHGGPVTMTYRREGKTLVFEGDWKGDAVRIELQQVTLDEFRLRSSGFHWINEVPFNRVN